MTTIAAEGYEYVFSEGSSDKYWQIFRVGTVVATRYGRRGALGQVTVHHENSTWMATERLEKLLMAKERKGYRSTRGGHVRFEVPQVIAEAAQSTNTTGRGGQNTAAAHALAAYYLAASTERGVELSCGDPLYAEVRQATITPRRLALGAFAGIDFKDPALRTADEEDIAVMAGLNSLAGGPSVAGI